MDRLKFEPVSPDSELPYDVRWGEYVVSLTPVIGAIATKLCGRNTELHADCVQQALMELLSVDPTRISGYKEYMAGQLSDKRWESQVSAYTRMAARNIMVSYLRSYRTGPLYTSRYKYVRDAQAKQTTKRRELPRYVRLEILEDEYGMQVDTEGNISWMSVFSAPDPNDDSVDPEHEY